MKTILVCFLLGAVLSSMVALRLVKERKDGQNQGYDVGWHAGSNVVFHQRLFDMLDERGQGFVEGWKSHKTMNQHLFENGYTMGAMEVECFYLTNDNSLQGFRLHSEDGWQKFTNMVPQ